MNRTTMALQVAYQKFERDMQQLHALLSEHVLKPDPAKADAREHMRHYEAINDLVRKMKQFHEAACTSLTV